MPGIDRNSLIQIFIAEGGEKIGDWCVNKMGWRVNENDFPENSDITIDFFPEKEKIFRSLEYVSPNTVKYLVLGQDPYPSTRPIPGGGSTPDAIGIAFIVDSNDPCDFPSSLKPFIGNLLPQLGKDSPTFVEWVAANRVLLLNAALTVPQLRRNEKVRDVASKHLKYWRKFTSSLVASVKLGSPTANLIAFGSEPRQVLCNGLEKAGCFSSCRHPTASSGNLQSFQDFWGKNKSGKELKRLASLNDFVPTN
jgi:uracil DNA glycosylase